MKLGGLLVYRLWQHAGALPVVCEGACTYVYVCVYPLSTLYTCRLLPCTSETVQTSGLIVTVCPSAFQPARLVEAGHGLGWAQSTADEISCNIISTEYNMHIIIQFQCLAYI